MKPEETPARPVFKAGSSVRRLADGRLELLPQPNMEEILWALWEALAEGSSERLNALKAKLARKDEPV